MSEQLAVIFDVDGVLVDSYRAHYESWRRLGQEYGFEITEKQFAATFGRTSREVIQELLGERAPPPAAIAAMDNRKEAIFRDMLSRNFPAMCGAAPLVDQLHRAGFALAAGSSGPPENVELVLENLGRRGLFDAVVTGADVDRGKPDPQVFLLAAQRLEIAPARCVVIEDAPAGVAAAQAAGMKCAAVVSTGRTRQELNSAELVVPSLCNLTPDTLRRLLIA